MSILFVGVGYMFYFRPSLKPDDKNIYILLTCVLATIGLHSPNIPIPGILVMTCMDLALDGNVISVETTDGIPMVLTQML